MSCVANPLTHMIARMLLMRGKSLSTAESFTAGGIAAELCAVPGASTWFKGAIVAYSEIVKESLLGVSENLIAMHGVVSRQVAEAMARGVIRQLGTDYAIATTGAAGPTAPDKDTPVGTAWIAIASHTNVCAVELHLRGTRRNITTTAIQEALKACYSMLRDNN